MTAEINIKRVSQILLGITFLFAILSFLGDLANSFNQRQLILDIFKVDKQISISSWYASSLLLIDGLMTIYIASSKNINPAFLFRWRMLAATFLFLSLARATALHTDIFGIIRGALSSLGWNVPAFSIGILFIILFAIVYLSFFKHLQRKIKTWILISAAFFVGGSLSMRAMGGMAWHVFGPQSILYHAFSNVEELSEMVGSIAFFYALAGYIELEQRAAFSTSKKAEQ